MVPYFLPAREDSYSMTDTLVVVLPQIQDIQTFPTLVWGGIWGWMIVCVLVILTKKAAK